MEIFVLVILRWLRDQCALGQWRVKFERRTPVSTVHPILREDQSVTFATYGPEGRSVQARDPVRRSDPGQHAQAKITVKPSELKFFSATLDGSSAEEL